MASSGDDFDSLLGETGEPSSDVPIINSPYKVPTLSVDTCMFATLVGETMRLQLAEFVPGAVNSAEPGMRMRYVANLTLPYGGFENMMTYLNGVWETVKASRDA